MPEILALPQPGAVGQDGAETHPLVVLVPAHDAIERLLTLARTQLGMEVALISEFTDERQIVRVMEPELETEWAARARRLETFQRIREVLDRGGLGVVFRPIFDLGSLSIVGYEALTRFQDGGSPGRWFAGAAKTGLGPDLERAAHQVTLACLDDLPGHAYLWVNLSPSAFGSATVRDMLAAVPGDRIIVGLSTKPEHEPGLERAVSDLRASGLRVAIDRMGGESIGLSDLFHLQPDVLRLGAGAVRAIDVDRSQRDTISFLVRVGCEVEAVTVADGIEIRASLDVLRDLGVTYGQGFALAPPLTPGELAHG
jgi:EAL domain-containing protein (putative c-di-GMP-specific phosphodiesterase class I)